MEAIGPKDVRLGRPCIRDLQAECAVFARVFVRKCDDYCVETDAGVEKNGNCRESHVRARIMQ